MSYLSRIVIDPTRRASWKVLASPQDMHALVARATAGEGEGRTLWRLDAPATGHPQLLLVSPALPSWGGFSEVIDGVHSPLAKPYEPLLDRLADEQRWRFRVTLNPTASLPADGAKRGKVVPVKTRDYLAWFHARTSAWGFLAEGDQGAAATVAEGAQSFLRRADRITLSTATFEGILTVTDATRLREGLVTGIGRAKGYGCGLMTLAKISV